jgi:murein DD-endopeptidase MepM/ murein hydrolase activator NlpD
VAGTVKWVREEHPGVDFLTLPGMWILAPHSGIYVRRATPYSRVRGERAKFNDGMLLKGSDGRRNIESKMFYCRAIIVVGSTFKVGEPIAFALDRSEADGTKSHVHWQLKVGERAVDPMRRLDDGQLPASAVDIVYST